MKLALFSTLLVAVASAAETSDSCITDACGRAVAFSNCKARRWPVAHENDCSSFLRYTSVPAPTTVVQTATEQSTVTLVDVVTLTPETEAETATQQDVTSTTSFTPDPETFVVSVIPTKIVVVTVTQDPLLYTEVNTVKVTNTDTANMAKRAVETQSPGTIIKPTRIPSYARSCSSPEQYSSACACLVVEETTIEGSGITVTETADGSPATRTQINTATRPAVTITTTLPAKTRTITITLPAPQVTESTTLDAVTISSFYTEDPDKVTITDATTQVDKTTSTVTQTRSVGPVCSTYTPSDSTCGCKFEVLCGRSVVLTDADTFFSHIDFLDNVGSFEECMSRCDNNPACQFGDFAELSDGSGLCSSYARNPGLAGTQNMEGYKYFEKNGNVVCSDCSSN
ncbi:hypothetical protein HG530_003902 [Fusarium avenaceum]|nr:hypothetical protein HG530_003902 [Fusarium avenaceum]